MQLWSFKAPTLSAEGIKYIIKGNNMPNKKLKIQSLIKAVCVFLYTEQKAETMYQKNIRNMKVNTKKIINLILIPLYTKFIFDEELFNAKFLI